MTNYDLEELNKYMFSMENLKKIEYNVNDTLKPVVKNKIMSRQLTTVGHSADFLFLKEKDTLFWCYYIIKNGITSYQVLMNNTFKEEKTIKIELVETIRDNKELLKKHKWKRDIMECDIWSATTINIQTFMCICAISKLNIAIVKSNYMCIQENNPGTETNIIVEDGNKYKLCILDRDEKKDLIEKYVKTKWIVDNISKPLLAISAYKLLTLQEIATKLKIPILDENDKRLRKDKLYNLIKSTI
tara:strand:+ start:13934 stop:14665 length:732 start_codon:yes stop_codon:yes gene_type:complete